MAIRAISLKPVEYISKHDDPDNPTIWLIRGLTRLEWMEVENTLQSSEIVMDGDNIKQIANKQNVGTVTKLLVDNGLVGWRNFLDEDGKEIPFTKENFDRIPKEICDELAGQISNLTSLSKEEQGN